MVWRFENSKVEASRIMGPHVGLDLLWSPIGKGRGT